jgi:hypothetical protein
MNTNYEGRKEGRKKERSAELFSCETVPLHAKLLILELVLHPHGARTATWN